GYRSSPPVIPAYHAGASEGLGCPPAPSLPLPVWLAHVRHYHSGAVIAELRADLELARAACMRKCFSHGILLHFHCCSFPWRNHPNPRTHQDRLIKKLRRKQIGTHAEVNAYLEREYLPEHNRRFARAATRPEDNHRPTPRRGVG